MEKSIKMSLETARKLWNDNKVDGYVPLIDFLLENFTKEELEGKKGFIWEESFDDACDGYYVSSNAQVSIFAGRACSQNKNIFKTEAQAKSALAFAQLSHIVAKYNEGKESSGDVYVVYFEFSSGLWVGGVSLTAHHLTFYTKRDAQVSIEVNRELWNDYWMINPANK